MPSYNEAVDRPKRCRAWRSLHGLRLLRQRMRFGDRDAEKPAAPIVMPNTPGIASMAAGTPNCQTSFGRLGAITVRAAMAGLLLGLAFGTTLAADKTRHAQESGPQLDARRHYYLQDSPDVGVLIAPETEHWRGNYVPDSYRLDDYDGVPAAPVRCSGSSGVTISTADTECPEGQLPSQGTRRWTTQP